MDLWLLRSQILTAPSLGELRPRPAVTIFVSSGDVATSNIPPTSSPNLAICAPVATSQIRMSPGEVPAFHSGITFLRSFGFDQPTLTRCFPVESNVKESTRPVVSKVRITLGSVRCPEAVRSGSPATLIGSCNCERHSSERTVRSGTRIKGAALTSFSSAKDRHIADTAAKKVAPHDSIQPAPSPSCRRMSACWSQNRSQDDSHSRLIIAAGACCFCVAGVDHGSDLRGQGSLRAPCFPGQSAYDAIADGYTRLPYEKQTRLAGVQFICRFDRVDPHHAAIRAAKPRLGNLDWQIDAGLQRGGGLMFILGPALVVGSRLNGRDKGLERTVLLGSGRRTAENLEQFLDFRVRPIFARTKLYLFA